MKGFKIYIVCFFLLLMLYVIAQLNKPREFDWTLTLQKNSREPYGAYILQQELHSFFPEKSIQYSQIPLYNTLQAHSDTAAVYLLLEPSLPLREPDISAFLSFIRAGNTAFIATASLSNAFADSLHIMQTEDVQLVQTDTPVINFVNPQLAIKNGYAFDHYSFFRCFDKIPGKDSARILGLNALNKPNFIQLNLGNGKIFFHLAPVCFTNYFLLKKNNADYTSKALSYLPSSAHTVYWDEYYKLGREGATTPLRFFLGNTFLKWALWLSIVALLIYAFIEMKRRQRIIPVVEPLRNTTVDFVHTVASVYLSRNDHTAIGRKKFQYWQEFIRRKYFLATHTMDTAFIDQLSKKSGIETSLITAICNIGSKAMAEKIQEPELLQLSNNIDKFYASSKIKKNGNE